MEVMIAKQAGMEVRHSAQYRLHSSFICCASALLSADSSSCCGTAVLATAAERHSMQEQLPVVLCSSQQALIAWEKHFFSIGSSDMCAAVSRVQRASNQLARTW
jgi:hypothetical protein